MADQGDDAGHEEAAHENGADGENDQAEQGPENDGPEDVDDQEDIDEDMLMASYLCEADELRELLGAAQLTRSEEDFKELLVRLLFTVGYSGDCHCLKVVLSFGTYINHIILVPWM